MDISSAVIPRRAYAVATPQHARAAASTLTDTIDCPIAQGKPLLMAACLSFAAVDSAFGLR
jgi:hypothetical protein